MAMSFFTGRSLKKSLIVDQVTSTTTAITSINVPRVGYNTALIILSSNGASDATNAVTLTPTLLEGPTTSPATAVTIAASDGTALLATHVSSATTATQTVSVYEIDLTNIDQNFKFVVTPSYGAGTPTVTVSAVCLLFDALTDPPGGTVATVYRKA